MKLRFSRVGVGTLVCGLFFFSRAAAAQTTAVSPAPVTPAPAGSAAAGAGHVGESSVAGDAGPTAPAPSAAPGSSTAPPGYKLVPIGEPDVTTRYDVQYPQRRGALPPGMELPYEEGQPIPPGYRLVKQSRRGLVIAGSIVTGVFWTISVMAAVGADYDNKSGFLVVPALGPWLMLAAGGANDECDGSEEFGCRRSGLRSALVLDGIVQTAGAAMLISGLAFPRKRLVRTDVTVSMLPQKFGRDSYGMSLVGTF